MKHQKVEKSPAYGNRTKNPTDVPRWYHEARWLRRFEKGWTIEALMAKFKKSKQQVIWALHTEKRRDIGRERYHRKYKWRQAEQRNRKEAIAMLEQAMETVYE